jgi:hypothetical protein
LHAVAEAAVGLPITLVLDNARYQKCALVQGLAASLGIELLYLPGYSPSALALMLLTRGRGQGPPGVSLAIGAHRPADVTRL